MKMGTKYIKIRVGRARTKRQKEKYSKAGRIVSWMTPCTSGLIFWICWRTSFTIVNMRNQVSSSWNKEGKSWVCHHQIVKWSYLEYPSAKFFFHQINFFSNALQRLWKHIYIYISLNIFNNFTLDKFSKIPSGYFRLQQVVQFPLPSKFMH